MNRKKIGILISYIQLIAGTLISLFLTPFLIKALGDVEYSLYKVMQSFAGPLAVFHLGISTIVTRAVTNCDKNNSESIKSKENTIALSIIVSVVVSVVLIIVGLVMCHFIPRIYSNTYSEADTRVAQSIFMCFLFSTSLHIAADAFTGAIIGREKYVLSSVILLSKTLLKPLLIVFFLKLDFGVVFVSLAEVFISLLFFVFALYYVLCVLHECPKLHVFDKKELVQIFTFGGAIILQALVNQVNNSVDIMILGAYTDDKSIITMYSSALTIFVLYNSLLSAITTFFLPSASRLLSRKVSSRELTDFVIRPGRFQAIVAVASIFGFALFGKEFISIWVGEKYINAYWIALMLMIPVTIPLVENAMITVLDASLKRMFRSTVLVFMAIINVVLSIAMVKSFGFWGAAIATVISLVLGHGVVMNWYYFKAFGFQVFRAFREIFRGIMLSGLVTALLCVPLAVFLPTGLLFFVIKCALFLLVYILVLYRFALNKTEKNDVLSLLKIFNV